MFEDFFWPPAAQRLREAYRQEGGLNYAAVRNINARIHKECTNSVFATAFLFFVLLFTPLPFIYVAGFSLLVALGLGFAAYRQIQNFFNEFVLPLVQGKNTTGTLDMIEKHTTTGYAHNGWVIRYSFEDNGQYYSFTRRLWAKEDASSIYKAGAIIPIFYMPDKPKYSIPAFSEITDNYNFKRGN